MADIGLDGLLPQVEAELAAQAETDAEEARNDPESHAKLLRHRQRGGFLYRSLPRAVAAAAYREAGHEPAAMVAMLPAEHVAETLFMLAATDARVFAALAERVSDPALHDAVQHAVERIINAPEGGTPEDDA